MENIEQKTAKTMLEKDIPIEIAGKTYQMPPVTGATLLLFSAEISGLKINGSDKDNFYNMVLRNASRSKDIAKALAILILGANKIEAEKGKTKNFIKQLFKRDELSELTKRIYYKLSIQEMSQLFLDILKEIQPTVFFSLIIFLNEVNVSKPTKSEMTVSGRSSEGS